VFKSLKETFEITTQYGPVTHPDPRWIVSCCILVGLIRGLLLGDVHDYSDIDNIIQTTIKGADGWVAARRARRDDTTRLPEPSLDHKEIWKHASQEVGDLRELDLDEEGSIGYV
jgi:hypothetical protein